MIFVLFFSYFDAISLLGVSEVDALFVDQETTKCEEK